MKKKVFILCILTAVTLRAQSGNVGINTANPSSNLTVNGSFAANYKRVTTTTYTMTNTDYYVSWSGASTGTITLPLAGSAAPSISGRLYHIKNTGTATLNIASAGTELLDYQGGAGVTSITLTPSQHALLIAKDTTSGTTWEVALVGTVTGTEPWLVTGGTPGQQATSNTQNIFQTGNVSLGSNLNFGGNLNVINDNSPTAAQEVVIASYSDTPVYIGSAISTYSARGNVLAPTNLQNGDLIFSLGMSGRAAGGWGGTSSIASYYTGNGTTNSTEFRFTVGGAERMRMLSTGNIGINTTSPTSTLSVNGTADKPGGGLWGSFSDMRIKKNIHDYTKGLKEILEIHPVTFQYNGKSVYKDDGKTYVGVIAQEIEKILPSTVTKINEGGFSDLRGYDSSELVYTLINAIKEQQKEIELLKQENKKLNSLEARINSLEQAKK